MFAIIRPLRVLGDSLCGNRICGIDKEREEVACTRASVARTAASDGRQLSAPEGRVPVVGFVVDGCEGAAATGLTLLYAPTPACWAAFPNDEAASE